MNDLVRIMAFSVPGEPVAKQRPRLGKHGNVYTPRKTQEAEDHLRWHFRANRTRPTSADDLSLRIRFFCGTMKRVDLDNLLKVVMDSGNGFLWSDDSQITHVEMHLERGSDDPRTELEVFAPAPLTAAA